MKIDSWLKPFWSIVARVVKQRLHEIVDSIAESDVERFKAQLHARIEKL